MGQSKKWTEREDDKLYQLYIEEGLTAKQVAKILRRSMYSVQSRLYLNDWLKGPKTTRVNVAHDGNRTESVPVVQKKRGFFARLFG